MCGRYTIVARAEEIEKRFQIEVPEFYEPRYNAAPSQILPVITNQSPNGLSFFKWGLIPTWAKDVTIGYKMINARAEALAEKPAFKKALKKRRCLVIADSFYEWKKPDKKTKIPYRILLKSGALAAFAGLWEQYSDKEEGVEIHSFTIVTTQANTKVSILHDRMPVILTPETEKIWLNDNLETEEHVNILQAPRDQDIEMYRVSQKVNAVQNDYPELITPLPPENETGHLFS